MKNEHEERGVSLAEDMGILDRKPDTYEGERKLTITSYNPAFGLIRFLETGEEDISTDDNVHVMLYSTMEEWKRKGEAAKGKGWIGKISNWSESPNASRTVVELRYVGEAKVEEKVKPDGERTYAKVPFWKFWKR